MPMIEVRESAPKRKPLRCKTETGAVYRTLLMAWCSYLAIFQSDDAVLMITLPFAIAGLPLPIISPIEFL